MKYNYRMLDHHIQRSIVYKLALSDQLRFSELKPDEIESKLFTYHLKKVVSAGYVEKNDKGTYALTPEGRRLGVHVLDNTQALIDRAYSVLFLVVRRKEDGAWLLYKRKNHPLINRIGFMHTTPTATETVPETAKRECLESTGISADFRVLGSGYFRIYSEEVLESFTNFTLLVADDSWGELVQNNELAEYYWAQEVNLNDPSLLPNMPTLLSLYQEGKPFFVEKTTPA